jgi:transposase
LNHRTAANARALQKFPAHGRIAKFTSPVGNYDVQADTVIADKAYDADQRVIQPLEQAGKGYVIPPRSNRKNPRLYDENLYKERHLIENFTEAFLGEAIRPR